MMTPFGPNRTMDASIANLFLFAYHMQKKKISFMEIASQ
jgi:hypothetical protein